MEVTRLGPRAPPQLHRRSARPEAECGAANIVAWVNVEPMKRAAEIGYVRFVLAGA